MTLQEKSKQKRMKKIIMTLQQKELNLCDFEKYSF